MFWKHQRRMLSTAKAAGPTRVGSDLFGIVHTLNRRGISVVISDFFAAGETAFELLRQLHAQRQEVIAFHLLSKDELELPYEEEYVMQDSETGEEVVVDAPDFRKEYLSRLEAYCARLQKECLANEVDYQRLRTDRPLDEALITYLDRRVAMG